MVDYSRRQRREIQMDLFGRELVLPRSRANLFERPGIKDLLSILSLLVDRRAMGLVPKPTLKGLATGLVGISLVGATAIVSRLRETDAGPLDWTNATFEPPELSQDDTSSLGHMIGMIGGFEVPARPWPMLARLLLDRTPAAALIATADDVANRAMGVAIWQFMGFLRAERAGPGLPVQRMLEGVRRLVQLADERDLRHLPQPRRASTPSG